MYFLKDKENLRSSLKKKRDALGKELRFKKSEKIADFLCEINEFKQSKTIFCYVSYKSEVETFSLINYILESDTDLFVPKIISRTKMIAVKLDDIANLEFDDIGILTPKSNKILSEKVDTVITPGIGFTKKGGRLGYGRGYYDRWFSINEVKTKIGIAFEEQVVINLPLEKTDINMDIIITEKEIIKQKNKL